MTTVDVTVAHDHSSRHRDEVARSTIVGCFYWLENYPPVDITEWTDNGNTALCPHCSVNSVIGDASGLPLADLAFLRAMADRWFSEGSQP